MALATSEILAVLRERGIDPTDDTEGPGFPGIGEAEEGETIYSTSIADVFGGSDDETPDSRPILDDHRLTEWWREIENIIRSRGQLPRA